MRSNLRAASVWLVLMIVGLNSSAQGGKFEVKPYVDIQTRYDDNIFLEGTGPDAEQKDFSIVVTPGVSVEWPVWKLYTQIFYQAGFGFYLDFGDNNYITHTLGGIFRFSPTKDLSFGLTDTLEISQLPEAGNETFTYNRIMGQAKYEWLEDLATSLTVSQSTYEDPGSSTNGDFSEVGWGIQQGYSPSSKTDLSLKYDTRTREFDVRPQKDYDEQEIRLHTTYRPWSGVTTWLNPGYKMRQFDDGDDANVVVTAKVSWRPTDHELSLGYDYDMLDTFEELEFEEFEGMTTNFASEMAYSELRTFATEYSHIYRQKISATWLWDVLSTTTLVLEGTFQNNEYQTDIDPGFNVRERNDDILIGTIGVHQKITKWFLFIVKYTQLTRNSNIAEEDYTSNRVAVEVLGSF